MISTPLVTQQPQQRRSWEAWELPPGWDMEDEEPSERQRRALATSLRRLTGRRHLSMSQDTLGVALVAAAETSAAHHFNLWPGLVANLRNLPPQGPLNAASASRVEAGHAGGAGRLDPRPPHRLQRAKSRLAPPFSRSDALLGEVLVMPFTETLVYQKRLSYKAVVVVWLVFVGTAGGLGLWALEAKQSGLPLVDVRAIPRRARSSRHFPRRQASTHNARLNVEPASLLSCAHTSPISDPSLFTAFSACTCTACPVPTQALIPAQAFFTAFSACTCTGLAVFNISAFQTPAKILLAVIMLCGSSILLSTFPLYLRQRALARNVPPELLKVRPPHWSLRTRACARDLASSSVPACPPDSSQHPRRHLVQTLVPSKPTSSHPTPCRTRRSTSRAFAGAPSGWSSTSRCAFCSAPSFYTRYVHAPLSPTLRTRPTAQRTRSSPAAPTDPPRRRPSSHSDAFRYASSVTGRIPLTISV